MLAFVFARRPLLFTHPCKRPMHKRAQTQQSKTQTKQTPNETCALHMVKCNHPVSVGVLRSTVYICFEVGPSDEKSRGYYSPPNYF